MSRATLHALLRDARPADPERPALDQAAVRVLARVAVLQGDALPAPRALRRRVAAALAAVVMAALTAATPSSEPQRSATDSAALGPADVLAALDGRREARRRLAQAGAAGIQAVWTVAEAGRPDALRLLKPLWPAQGARQRERLEAAVARPDLGAEALDVLLSEPAGVAGPTLARILVTRPELEASVVERLDRLARRGARSEAVAALLEGAAAGRRAAAVLAVEHGPAGVVDGLLARLSETALGDARLGSALAAARPTLAARVVERALAGDRGALAWAATARRSEVVPALLHEAVGDDEERAVLALDRLAEIGSTEAWLAVARALEAPAGVHARELLARLPFAAAEELDARARGSARDRSAALCALAASGAAGLDRVLALGRRPALTPEALAALADSPCAGASDRLVALAGSLDSPLPGVLALGRRLARGHGEAGDALLAVSRAGPRRAALEQIAGAGEHGAQFLARALLDAELAPTARKLTARTAAPAARASRPY
jgi:hypothetical protein